MPREICPCKGCAERFVDEVLGTCCRTSCKKYIDWKDAEQVRKKQINDYLTKNNEIRSFRKEQVEKAMKRRRS